MLDRICEHFFIKKLIGKNSIVLDLGANEGGFSKEITNKYGCKSYAIEPVPAIFDSIKETELIKKINGAISSKSGTVEIFLPDDRCATAYDYDKNTKSIISEAFTLGDLVKKFGIKRVDMIKMDIEGEEVPIFESLTKEELQMPAQWTVEFHDFLYPELNERVENIKKKMIDYGFYCIPFSITNNGDILFVKRESISSVTYFYLRYILRYWLGFKRRFKKICFPK